MDSRIRDAGNLLARGADMHAYVASVTRYFSDPLFDPTTQVPATFAFRFELRIGGIDYTGRRPAPIVANTWEGLRSKLLENTREVWRRLQPFLDKIGNLTQHRLVDYDLDSDTHGANVPSVGLSRVPIICFAGNSFVLEASHFNHQMPFRVIKELIDEVFGKDILDRKQRHLAEVARKAERSAAGRANALRRLEQTKRHALVSDLKNFLAAGDEVGAQKLIETADDEKFLAFAPMIIRDYGKK